MRSAPLSVVLVALLSGCMTSTTPTVPLNREFTLAPGETTIIDETSIGVSFFEVTGDSRCPADAFCIQGGDAVVKIQVKPVRGGPVIYELHTGSMAPVSYEGQTITLVQLTPYPFSTRTIQQQDYRATLRVTR